MADITGVWIGDAEDGGPYRELFLAEQGTGWFEYGREHYTVIAELTWCHVAPNRIRFTYGEVREIDRHGVERGTPEDADSHDYEFLDGEVLRFTPPYRGAGDFRRGRRNSPFRY